MAIHVEVIIGLDPGRDKVGWAAVGLNQELLLSGIFPAQERALFWRALGAWSHVPDALDVWVLERLTPVCERGVVAFFVVGKGTGGRDLAEDLEKQAFGCQVFHVDERGTTLEARSLYWRLHSPSWWQRFLPRTLWVPPRPLDDLAAWAIAMRGITEIRG